MIDKPFSNFINIIQIEELKGRVPRTIFKLKDSHGKLYKLRKYSSIKFAKYIESSIRLVPQFFPKLYGRDRNYLLFDFLQGRSLVKNENLGVFFKLGKMSGEANKIKIDSTLAIDNAKCSSIETNVRKKIKFILEKRIITKADYRRILWIFKKLKQEMEYDIVLDFLDISPTNLIIDSENKLYCIDDEGIGYSIKGYGFINPLIHWFNKEQKRSFFNGYNSVNSTKFFHKNYEKFLTLLYCIDKVVYKSKAGIHYSDLLKRLLEFK